MVDPAVEAVVEGAQDGAEVAVDEVLLITETVITTSTMTTVPDRGLFLCLFVLLSYCFSLTYTVGLLLDKIFMLSALYCQLL